MANLGRIIDVHSHAILPGPRGTTVGAGFVTFDWAPESALAHMDEHGIAACVLSLPDVANHATGQEARDLARSVNERLAAIVSAHPSRFGALATLPGQDPESCLEEMSYALDVLGLDGVATSTSIGGTYLGDPSFDPWFEELDRRGATLFVHPCLSQAGSSVLLGLNPSVLEFMFETTRMITNMVVTGAKRRFGRARILVTHGGGTVPFLAQRIATLVHAFGVGPERVTIAPSEIRTDMSTFYYDLTAATSPAQLAGLLELVSPSQLLLGLDFPFMPAATFASAITELAGNPRLGEPQLQAVLRGNAQRLFPGVTTRAGVGS